MYCKKQQYVQDRRPGRGVGQFCTTPPVGILLGWRSKSLGWIPIVILLSQPYFCTKRKLNKHVTATSSLQNPTNFYSFSFPFHLLMLGFWWDAWLVTRMEKWKLTKTMDGGTIYLAQRGINWSAVYYQKLSQQWLFPKFLKFLTCSN